jgi:hypothetical protein
MVLKHLMSWCKHEDLHLLSSPVGKQLNRHRCHCNMLEKKQSLIQLTFHEMLPSSIMYWDDVNIATLHVSLNYVYITFSLICVVHVLKNGGTINYKHCNVYSIVHLDLHDGSITERHVLYISEHKSKKNIFGSAQTTLLNNMILLNSHQSAKKPMASKSILIVRIHNFSNWY